MAVRDSELPRLRAATAEHRAPELVDRCDGRGCRTVQRERMMSREEFGDPAGKDLASRMS